MKIGCHISVGKGYATAAKNAARLEAQSFQIFTKNPRGFRTKVVDPKDAAAGRAVVEEHGLLPVAHTPYITNLSTPKEDLHELTITSILNDLEVCDAFGIFGAVVHCGKHVEMTPEYGIDRMIETLDKILDQYDGSTLILLENTAGQGTELGTSIEDLVVIRSRLKQPERVGFCFDTCHSFAAGQWTPDTWGDLVAKMKETGYLDHLKVVHLNDSKAPFGSRKDRHEKLGQGEIGEAGIQAVLNTPEFVGLPVVLETPVKDEDEYGPEMAYARSLRG